jgi:predicted HTH transcriptional regulator
MPILIQSAMTIQEIIKLAKQGEGLHLEFKKKAAYPEKIVKEVIALANTEGGKLLLGVDDDGTVSGQRFIEEEIFVLEKAIRELIFPKVEYQTEMLKLTEKKGVAVFHIEKSPQRPHYILEEERKKAFVRVKDQSIQASKEMWEILKREKYTNNTLFTYGEKENVLMKALDQEATITLKQFVKLAKLPKFIASKTLVKLVHANVLQIIPQEKEDLYRIKP